MPGLKQALVEGHQREACLVPPPRFAQRARLARVPWGLPLCPSLLAMPAWCLAAVCCAAGAPSTGCPLDWEAPRVLLRMDFPGGTKASVTLRHWCVMARSPEILWCQAVGAAWARGPLASALCCPRWVAIRVPQEAASHVSPPTRRQRFLGHTPGLSSCLLILLTCGWMFCFPSHHLQRPRLSAGLCVVYAQRLQLLEGMGLP